MADLKLLQAGASELGLHLTREQLSAFSLYMNELMKWNQRANLTAITAPDEIQTKHFLDSLTCLLAFPWPDAVNGAAAQRKVPHDLMKALRDGEGLSCLDIGTGAGFPGVPLKICLPKMRLTLTESIGKKTAFLSHLASQLKLDDVRVLTVRAEDLARQPGERGSYHVVVARAISRVAVIAELGLPFCRPGGRVVAPKKGAMEQEILDGSYAVGQMGGRYLEDVPVRVSTLEDDRRLLVMEKVSPTPAQYPRRAGMPAKSPLAAPAGRR